MLLRCRESHREGCSTRRHFSATRQNTTVRIAPIGPRIKCRAPQTVKSSALERHSSLPMANRMIAPRSHQSTEQTPLEDVSRERDRHHAVRREAQIERLRKKPASRLGRCGETCGRIEAGGIEPRAGSLDSGGEGANPESERRCAGADCWAAVPLAGVSLATSGVAGRTCSAQMLPSQ